MARLPWMSNAQSPQLVRIYECGICGCCHPWEWDGDCREDANRFFPDDYAAGLGLDETEIEVFSWEERVEADMAGRR